MNKVLLNMYKKLVSDFAGLRIREQDTDKFMRTIESRIQTGKFASEKDYYDFLKQHTAASEAEWKTLVGLLTTAETFFFRDKGQFSLLENKILPKLIKKRQSEKKMRIWSAGCSSGEEPYSLAILLDKLLPQKENWSLHILGTDINEQVLHKAREAYYTQWSFRMFDKNMLNQYFHTYKNGWRLNDDIKKMVTFQQGNLKKDEFPSRSYMIFDMDLILCRNVFIYFDPDSVSQVLKKFTKTLRSDGYLITGHAELYGHKLGMLNPKFFPESVVYQLGTSTPSSDDQFSRLESNLEKIEKKSPQSSVYDFGMSNLRSANKTLTELHENQRRKKKKSAQSKPKNPFVPTEKVEKKSTLPTSLKSQLVNIKSMFDMGNYWGVIRKAEEALEGHPNDANLIFYMAKAYANLGNHSKATDFVNQILKIDPYFTQAYFLLAQIAEEDGKPEDAKLFLNKIIYIDPSFVPAYLELSSLFEVENNHDRALKLRTSALKILQSLSPETLIEPYENLTAEELIQTVKEMI